MINESQKVLHSEEREWGLLETDLNIRKVQFQTKKNKNDKLLKSKMIRKMKDFDRSAYE